MEEQPKLYTTFAKYYDRLESQYRNYVEDSRWIRSVLEPLGAKKVIDVSCGTGNHVTNLAAEDRHVELYAMDSSRQMVSIASKKNHSDKIEFILADFLNLPLQKDFFDSAICMYWSLAGLNDSLVQRLFGQVNTVLGKGGTFIFDVENAEGIKTNLLDMPFIDSFFHEEDKAIIRANLSRKVEYDVVDWRAYYLIEAGGATQLSEDRMKLRFYSRGQLEGLLSETGFEVVSVSSGPFKKYEPGSPSLYFVARKIKSNGS